MATSSRPSKSKAAVEPGATPPVSSDVDERLHGFWKEYGQYAVVVCAIILLFYIGKMGWDFFAAQRENSVRAEYLAAKNVAQLKAFIADHPDHRLTSVARLSIAHQDYADGNIAQALLDYKAVEPSLKGDPLDQRALIGIAICEIELGQRAQGEDGLRAILDDTHQLPVVRVEAGSQLASALANEGKRDEVQKIAMQLVQLDQNSPWTQRALTLSASLPAAPKLGLPPEAK
jgi:hypothetical protein